MPRFYHCALWNTARFFAPLVGSRLSNSPIGEGMWRHAANCGRYVGQPCKDSTPMFMTFPTNSGLTLMSKWVPIYHHRRPSGKSPFFLGFVIFFTTMITGKERSSCFTWPATTSRRLRSAFLSRNTRRSKCVMFKFLQPLDSKCAKSFWDSARIITNKQKEQMPYKVFSLSIWSMKWHEYIYL